MGLDVSWAIMEERREQNASSHKQQEVSPASEGRKPGSPAPSSLARRVHLFYSCKKHFPKRRCCVKINHLTVFLFFLGGRTTVHSDNEN